MAEITRDKVAELLANLPDRIGDVIRPWADSAPDQPALTEPSGTWTYQQLALVVAETQTWLLESGVRPGDRVMVVCENCRAFVAILLAIAGIDAWPALVSARLSAKEVDAIRDHCGARRVIYTTSVSLQAREHAKRHGAVTQDVASLGSIAVGPLNEKVEPEPIDDRDSAARRRADLHIWHNRTSQGRDVDAPEPAVRRIGVSQNPVTESG